MLNSAIKIPVVVASNNQPTSTAKIVGVGALATWTSTFNIFALFILCS
jgi:hypothetical protein